MARSTRTDFAKVKVWMPNMTSEMEGTIAGIALEVFCAIDGREKRLRILDMMKARHDAMCAREGTPVVAE